MPPEDERARLVAQWLEKAEEDLLGADLLQQSGRVLGLATYHCQQAVEKALKGFLSLHDRPFRRTHNLSELLHQCVEIDGGFAELLDAAKLVSPYITEFRYPSDVARPTREQTAAGVRAAREVVAFVRARIAPGGTA